jgi:hypothetical protein
MMQSVRVSALIKKDRTGLPKRAARFSSVDRQQGTRAAGELPHWWQMIQDVALDEVRKKLPNGKESIELVPHFLVVWEGKCLTDEEVADNCNRHAVNPLCVAVDSSHDSENVYAFCLKHGYNAVKVEPAQLFPHPDGSRRIFSVPKPLYQMIGLPPSREDPDEEPEFWHMSLYGSLERLHFLMNGGTVKYEIPSDVSSDFLSHMESWELQTRKVPRTNETVPQWVQVRKRDDLRWCAACIAVQAEMAELIGAYAVEDNKNEKTNETPKETK